MLNLSSWFLTSNGKVREISREGLEPQNILYTIIFLTVSLVVTVSDPKTILSFAISLSYKSICNFYFPLVFQRYFPGSLFHQPQVGNIRVIWELGETMLCRAPVQTEFSFYQEKKGIPMNTKVWKALLQLTGSQTWLHIGNIWGVFKNIDIRSHPQNSG